MFFAFGPSWCPPLAPPSLWFSLLAPPGVSVGSSFFVFFAFGFSWCPPLAPPSLCFSVLDTLGAILDASLALLDTLGSLLSASWIYWARSEHVLGGFGKSWGRFWPLLGLLLVSPLAPPSLCFSLLGALGAILGASLALLDALGSFLSDSWIYRARSEHVLGGFGVSWGRFWALLEPS